MQKKTNMWSTYLLLIKQLFSINWQKLKEWSARLALIIGLATALASIGNGFVAFLATRVSEHVNSDIQAIRNNILTITNTNIPFLADRINAISDTQRRHDLEDRDKINMINEKLDKVATKDQIELLIQALKK